MKHSVQDDIENSGTLLVQNPATMFFGIAQCGVAGYKDVSNDNVQTLISTVAQQPKTIDSQTGQSSKKIVLLWCVDRFLRSK